MANGELRIEDGKETTFAGRETRDQISNALGSEDHVDSRPATR